jgi:hypothetical protein
MTSPATLLRGLRKRDFIIPNTTRVHGRAFEPAAEVPAHRADGCLETSIDFEDDDGALPRLRRDRVNAAHGVARLKVVALDMVKLDFPDLPPHDGPLVSYERRPVDNNDYHGNILFSGALEKHHIVALAGVIACSAKLVTD